MSDRSTDRASVATRVIRAPSRPVASPSVARLLVAGALLLTIVAVITPFDPRMPTGGLDNSWMVAMNEAVARRLPIGEAVIFTFGPYAGLYTQVFHPDLDARMILAGLVVAMQCFICVRRIASGRRTAAWLAFGLAFLFFAYSLDAILICAAMLSGLYAWTLAETDQGLVRPRRAPVADLASLAFVFASLALLALVKVTFVSLDGPMMVIVVAGLVYKGRRDLAVAACAGFAAGFLGFWLVAGQPLGAVYGYFRSSVDIISGYTDAMSVAGDPSEVVAYWIVSAIALIAIACAPIPSRSSRVWLAAMVGLVLMTASKSGFVRHDFHATIAAAVVCLTLLSLRLAVATRLTTAALVAACCLAFYFDTVYVHSSTNSTLARITGSYRSLWNGAASRLDGGADRRARYDRALVVLRNEQPYPSMPGTTDIYSYDQAHLIASGNRWNPRPIFQSYSAYNTRLADINRRHLVGPAAPDNVLMRIEPIDGHLPLSEEGPSWPELLTRYRPTALSGDLIQFSRRADAVPLIWKSSQGEEYAFGEPIQLADSSSLDFVRLDVHPTIVGRLVSFLYRIDPPHIALTLRDGSTHEYRLVSKSAAAGFIASPLVETVREAVQLYSPAALAARRVKTLTVDVPPGASAFWNTRFTMSVASFSVDGTTDLSTVFPMDRMSDDTTAPESSIADCFGSIDLINEQRDFSRLETGSLLKVDGWMDMQSPTVPSRDVFITLTDAEGRRRFLSTHPTQRPDVAAYLKRPELTDAGYSTTADLSKLTGPMTVGMAYQAAGHLVRCRQFAIPLRVKR